MSKYLFLLSFDNLERKLPVFFTNKCKTKTFINKESNYLSQ
jgi:hypothetical protein